MKSLTMKRLISCTGMLWLLVTTAHAYPPAPDHTFHGMVRNEWGDPIDVRGAKVFVHSTDGAGAAAPIAASTLPGSNYQLVVPMDSARSTKIDFTSAGSLRQSQPFRLKVQIGSITYLPIEMLLTRPLGEPAGTSRLDLTLGADTDGDGLPDAWETGNGLNPTDPSDANRDSDGDGISNRNEYLAGTYAFDAGDGFRLGLVEQTGSSTTLEFFAVRGRTYTFQSSTNLLEWTPVTFRTQAGGPLQSNYPASEHKTLRLDVPSQDGETNRFFRALVQ